MAAEFPAPASAGINYCIQNHIVRSLQISALTGTLVELYYIA